MNKIDGDDQFSAGGPYHGVPPAAAHSRPPSGERFWRALFCGLSGILVLGCAAVAVLYFQGVIGLSVSSDGSGQAAETRDRLSTNVFARHMHQAGMKKCTTVFPLLGDMLVAGSRYSARTYWNAEEVDAHMVQTLVGLDYETPGYKGPAGGLIFAAPLPNGGCEGAMVRIAPFAKSCKDVVSLLPKGSAPADNLSGVQTYALGNGQGQAMLIPAANAYCIAVSTTAVAQ